ncbi:probable pectinesterase precursor [Cephalotrichum gorgonifer]|uniref:Pectinesterase n=1 Tax=Cephalotrichum gorgonifer TaxID=2041049 RepID=A0AAE8N803_9PEZI|nr:probable pectinesterase precursor [Cephalotrichum gorgonifer]
MKSLIAGLALVASVVAESRTSAPPGCVTVSSSGGDFTSIQQAVDSFDTGSSGEQCIFLSPGTYNEQVLISSRSAQFTIYGYTDDTSSYAGNKATITGRKSQADGLSNDQTATLRVKAKNFKLYNVNVANTYGEGSQAVALSAAADSGYYGSAFTGFQDTVLANSGKQLYANCLIQGATDFIFGKEAPAWFEACDIRVVAKPLGYITANGRGSAGGTSYYVFNNAKVGAASGHNVPDGAYYLGRPWGAYARVVFQNSQLSAVVNPQGWRIWNVGDERTEGVTFAEYNNSGKGAQGTRASFSKSLSAAVSISDVLGGDYSSAGYYDASYM